MKEYIFEAEKVDWLGAYHVNEVKGELIRCKNCKHWDGYYCHNKRWDDGYGYYTPPIKKEDGFCDWADRKEHDDHDNT